jgi:hypothetical protein
MNPFHYVLSLFGFPRASRPEDIPHKLNAAVLSQAMEEARKLHVQHDVSVRSLSRGELPIPRRADDA